jgi:hypothetical protein
MIFVGAAAMHVKKPDPLPARESKPVRICAVCGQVSYSQGGIHPQCAQEQADAGRVARIKAENKAELKDKPNGLLVSKPWCKACPKCQLQMHVRKRTCECGYRFR